MGSDPRLLNLYVGVLHVVNQPKTSESVVHASFIGRHFIKFHKIHLSTTFKRSVNVCEGYKW